MVTHSSSLFHPSFLSVSPHFLNQLLTHLYPFTSPFSSNIRFCHQILSSLHLFSSSLSIFQTFFFPILRHLPRREAVITQKCKRQILIIFHTADTSAHKTLFICAVKWLHWLGKSLFARRIYSIQVEEVFQSMWTLS